MSKEVEFLWWGHGCSSNALDRVFLLSHYIGGGRAWRGIIVACVLGCLVVRRFRHAAVWAVLGICVDVSQSGPGG